MLKEFVRAAAAVHARNLRLVQRQRNLVAQTLVLPVALLLLVAFIFGGSGDAWPVAVVDESGSAMARDLVHTLETLESEITPYFTVMDVDLEEARSLVDRGRLHLLVHIPTGFESDKVVRIRTYNINSDAMKNVRLRLDYALNELEARWGVGGVRGVLETERSDGVRRSAYIGGSAVLLALLLGSVLVAANLFVFDLEHRTRSEVLVTPVGSMAAGVGILVSAVTVALVASLIPLTASWLLFYLSVDVPRLLATYAGMIPIMIGCAGIGVLLGQLLRTYRSVQPIIILAAIATFFAGGGFVGVSMLHPTVQTLADVWVFSRIFMWFNPILHGFASGLGGSQWLLALFGSVLGLLLTGYAYHRERRVPPVPSQ